MYNWLVVYLPLWKIWIRQLGWWHSQYMGSHKSHVPSHQPVICVCVPPLARQPRTIHLSSRPWPWPCRFPATGTGHRSMRRWPNDWPMRKATKTASMDWFVRENDGKLKPESPIFHGNVYGFHWFPVKFFSSPNPLTGATFSMSCAEICFLAISQMALLGLIWTVETVEIQLIITK